jgi:hypothetical protein
VNLRLKDETSKHYNMLNNKFNKLIKHQKIKKTFYPRLHNMTNMQLSKTEETLLNKGSKYNMEIAPKMYKTVCENKNTIRQLNINQQGAIRHIATKIIQQIISKQKTINREYKQ